MITHSHKPINYNGQVQNPDSTEPRADHNDPALKVKPEPAEIS